MVDVTNQLGIHALCWTADVDREAMGAACRGSREAGFDLIEIALLEPELVDPDVVREEIVAAGLAATCSTGLSFGTDISSTDVAVVEDGRQFLLQCLAIADGIGASYLGGVLFSAMDKYRERPTPQGRANCVAVLRELSDAAREVDITIGLEPVNRYESNLINTAAQAIELIGEIGSDNVVVHLDSYHVNIEEDSQGAAVRHASEAGLLGYVHLGENHRGALGSGQADLPALLKALVGVGYGGPMVFESFSAAVTSEAFVASLAVWRDLWTDSTELARTSYRYLTETLHEASRR